MSLRARPVQSGVPCARLYHVMTVGHAAIGTKTPEPTADVTLDEFLVEFDNDIAANRPTKADVTKWRKEAQERFKKVAGPTKKLSKQKARDLVDFVVKSYNGAKDLEHWFTATDKAMAKIMCEQWRRAFSPKNWKNMKITPNGDRHMCLETGANLSGHLHIDRHKGMIDGKEQDTIWMELIIRSAIPNDLAAYKLDAPQQLGSELVLQGMDYNEFASKLDRYIYTTLAMYYAKNEEAIKWSKNNLTGTVGA